MTTEISLPSESEVAMTSTLRSTVAVIAFIVIGAVTFMVTYALTPIDERVDLLHWFWASVPTVLAGIPGVLAWIRSNDAAKISQSNARALNGSLDQRIAQGATVAIHTYMETREQTARVTDPVEEVPPATD